MILRALPLALLLISTALAQNAPWPMPSPLPAWVPPEESPTVPAPRVDWLSRVAQNIANGQRDAASIQLVFDGDSITDAWQTGAAKPLWEERFSRYGTINFAIGGDRTENVLWRLSQGQAKGMKPKLIVLMIGTNNVGQRAVTPENIARGVAAVVAEYRRVCPEAVILLQAIFPRGESAQDPLRLKVRATNELLKHLGDGKNLIYVDFGDRFLEADGTMSREIMGDFLHPARKGYEIWAEAIQPTIDKYLAE